MKYQFILAIILVSSNIAMAYRVQRDFREFSKQARTPVVLDFDYVPALKGFDFSGKPVVLPPALHKVVLMPLHQADYAVQCRIWQDFFALSGSDKEIMLIGVHADANCCSGGAGLDGAPWFRSVAYASYLPLAFVADLDRKNEIAILDKHGIVQKRIPRPADAKSLEEAIQ